MDTAQVEAFLTLAEELHFGRAAQRLRVSQPRVSRLIAALERQAGGRLFERTSRKVSLTPLGQQFHAELRPGYQQMRAALDHARRTARAFTQRQGRDQLVECTIEAIVKAGYPRTTVAEVARRAGASKGVVTCQFPAKDDLVQAVITDVIAEMAQYLEPRLRAANPLQYPERFIAAYLTNWTGYIQTHGRDLLALVRIYNAFRDETGRPNPAFDVRATDISIVAQILRHGQESGRLGCFDPQIMATVMKAALDDLLTQYADNPELDLHAYGTELVAIFENATRPDDDPATNSAPASQQANAATPSGSGNRNEEQ
jgi:TetR/AcrR family transcriptional regulator, fatty acid metabolism regulator protein